MQLRPYQREAIDALYSYFENNIGNPLIVMPTGTGKAVTIADFIKGAVQAYPDTRVLMITHVKELISQNYQTIIRNWPDAPAGVYSAGLGKRDIGKQILCGGIQSIHRKAYDVQRCDLLIVDECHLIPRNSSTMYGKFIADLRTINPYMKIVGFTATPYRMDSGMLHRGKGALFDDVAYEMSILDAVQDGYLCEVIPKRMATQLDVTGVGSRGGEFIPGQLERAVDKDEITKAAVAEIVQYGQSRAAWLVFAAGVDHAEHVRDEVRSHGYSAEVISDRTSKGERDRYINDFKAGRLRALVNVSVLTTGFDAPNTDLIAMIRPTKSPGLFVQMVGRGTRPIDGNIGNLPTSEQRLEAIARSAKPNCLLLDFAGNTSRHGPVDKITVDKTPSEGTGEAPVKECPQCHEVCFAGVRYCPTCLFEFPEPQPELNPVADNSAVLSSQVVAEWIPVFGVEYYRHTKAGGNTTLRVEYKTGIISTQKEWVCFEHTGFPRDKAVRWWQRRLPGVAPPNTVAEALQSAKLLRIPTKIQIKPNGKYREIIGHAFD